MNVVECEGGCGSLIERRTCGKHYCDPCNEAAHILNRNAIRLQKERGDTLLAERDALRKERDDENRLRWQLGEEEAKVRAEAQALGALVGKLLCIADLHGRGGENIDHADALLDWARALRAENERLREALEKIIKPRYGLEITDTDEQRAEYWSITVSDYRMLARAALKGTR